jgi:hypothetical protein
LNESARWEEENGMKIVSVVMLIAATISLFAVFIRGQKPNLTKGSDPKEVYLGLRLNALTGFGGSKNSQNQNEPIAVLMEMGIEKGTATIVAYKDGTGAGIQYGWVSRIAVCSPVNSFGDAQDLSP